MTSRTAGAFVLLVLLAFPAAAAFAQRASAGRDDAIDARRLPVSLVRIHRELRQSAVREEREGLNLRYNVEVFGQAPPLELFTPGENLSTGPVPDSAPTHRDMIEHVTPREYRAPAADFNALLRWLAERGRR
jgi:hypothetical protein